jgi:hypothetical protein
MGKMCRWEYPKMEEEEEDDDHHHHHHDNKN